MAPYSYIFGMNLFLVPCHQFSYAHCQSSVIDCFNVFVHKPAVYMQLHTYEISALCKTLCTKYCILICACMRWKHNVALIINILLAKNFFTITYFASIFWVNLGNALLTKITLYDENDAALCCWPQSYSDAQGQLNRHE